MLERALRSNGNVAVGIQLLSSCFVTTNPQERDIWEDILYQLRRNKLTVLRLGWRDSAPIPGIRSLSSALARVLRSNTSLCHISIGWNWSNGNQPQQNDLLLLLLTTLAENLRPQQLQSIQLVLTQGSIPSVVLARLFESQTAISSLELQTVNTTTNYTITSTDSNHTATSSCSSSSASSTHSTNGRHSRPPAMTEDLFYTLSSTTGTDIGCRGRGSGSGGRSGGSSGKKEKSGVRTKRLLGRHRKVACENTVVSVLLQSMVPNHRYQVMSQLRLVDCDLNDDVALRLARDIMPVSVLSVRGNRKITGRGAAALIRACAINQSPSLDLSLCDLEATDFVLIAQALGEMVPTAKTRRSTEMPFFLNELWLRGNYRMEIDGVTALMAVAPYVVQSLDLAYCGLSSDMTVHIFQTLTDMGNGQTNLKTTQNNTPTSNVVRLRNLLMHGCRICGDSAVEALVIMLRQNSRVLLRSLALQDDKNARPYLNKLQMQAIAEAMKDNYEMEDLTFDFFKNSDEQRIWKEIELWQVLNRAGRRMLLRSENSLSLSTASADAVTAMFANVDPASSSSRRCRDRRIAKAQQDDIDAWIRLIDVAKTEPGIESLYWVVRNSVERFNSNRIS